MERDLFGHPIAAPARKPGGRIGYAARPGTGPKGQRCNTCAHFQRVVQDGRKAAKCELAARVWSAGERSDVKHNAPACRDWQRREWRKQAA